MKLENTYGGYSSPIPAAQLQPGDIVANIGVVDAIRRDGVFVVASIRGTVWSLATGTGDIHNLDYVWHESDTLTVTDY